MKHIILIAIILGTAVAFATRRGQLMNQRAPAAAGGGGSDPLSISGMVGWYVADDLVTSSNLVNTDPISMWGDRSGNDNTLTNLQSGKRPTVVTSQFNGHAAASFDGSDDFLNRTSPVGYSGESGQTIITACQYTSGDAGTAFGNIINTGTFNEFRLNAGMAQCTAIFAGANCTATATVADSTNSFYLAIFDDAANQTTIKKNGIDSNGPCTEGGSFSGTVIRLACRSDGTLHFKGNITEVIIYNKPLSAGEQLTISNYLAGRYGFP